MDCDAANIECFSRLPNFQKLYIFLKIAPKARLIVPLRKEAFQDISINDKNKEAESATTLLFPSLKDIFQKQCHTPKERLNAPGAVNFLWIII